MVPLHDGWQQRIFIVIVVLIQSVQGNEHRIVAHRVEDTLLTVLQRHVSVVRVILATFLVITVVILDAVFSLSNINIYEGCS